MKGRQNEKGRGETVNDRDGKRERKRLNGGKGRGKQNKADVWRRR